MPAKILGRYGIDRLSGLRGSRLAMGNALIGRLLLSLKKRNVEVLTQTSVREFIVNAGKVEGVVLQSLGVVRNVAAVRGVVLAAGGYTRHKTRRAAMLHHPTPEFSPAAPGAPARCRISRWRWAHGSAKATRTMRSGRRFPSASVPMAARRCSRISCMDRSKPGTVCVNQQGRRFVNESASTTMFGRAMFESHRTAPAIPVLHRHRCCRFAKIWIGYGADGTRDIGPFLADGYLVKGDTIAELAARLEIPAPALEETIAAMNAYAKTGVDPEFGRGTTAYHRVNGDASFAGPNPTLGPIATPPYYAVRLYPGDIGAATGLVIDEWSRVLKEGNEPIEGLYACGNEANSIMGGTYPDRALRLGPASPLRIARSGMRCMAPRRTMSRVPT